MATTEFTLRLSLALLFGACIGMERQWRQRMAGLRTNTLVSLGAALFTALSVEIGGEAMGRVTSYIVSGIGFLGAGVIMKQGANVTGINTAATLWCSAAIGALCGTGHPIEALIGTAFIIFCHLMLRPAGFKIADLGFKYVAASEIEYLITVRCKSSSEAAIRALLLTLLASSEQLTLHAITGSKTEETGMHLIVAELIVSKKQELLMEQIASRLGMESDVKQVKWEIMSSHIE